MSVSRRDFLKTSGALVVSFSANSLLGSYAMGQGPFDTHRSHIDPAQLDSWIAVSADGTVTAFSGKCDFGQGMLTVQTQLVAEELCVPLHSVKIVQCDTAVCPDQGTTSGSQSTPTNFNLRNLAQAAATAREALIDLAAKQFNESANQLTVAEGIITGKNGHRVTYARLIGSKRFDVPLNMAAKRRSPDRWTVLGKPVPSRRSRGLDDRTIRVRAQRPRARHVARTRGAPAGGRRQGYRLSMKVPSKGYRALSKSSCVKTS